MMGIKILKIIAVALAAVCLLTAAAGCGRSDGKDRVFRYDIDGNPILDPQQSNDANSDLIIENVFMGLLSTSRDGSILSGAASDYIVSKDGLVYDFKLRSDVFWMDGDKFEAQCTAKDFVFGFTRLFSPETESERAEDYFCIKNAELFRSGRITDASLLGVKAKGDFELEIVLEYPNPRFPAMLAEAPAMPCCEEFFLGSQGKYGRSAECTPSNGAFYVKSWTYEPYASTDINNLVLRRNYKNAESREICPSGLNFFIRSRSRFINDFLTEDTNCIAVSNNDKALIKGDHGCEEFCSITCGLVFNRDYGLFRNNDFRKAMALLTDSDAIVSAIPEFEKAGGVVPRQVSMLEKSYRGIVGDCLLPGYDVETARELFQKAKPQLDMSLFTGARIIVPDSTAETVVSYIMQEWQREFGFYCKVEVLDSDDYRYSLENGDFDIAIVELSGKYNSPAAYLEQFCGGNLAGFSDKEFESVLKQAEEAAELSESAEIFLRAERLLIEKTAFLPIYYKNEYFFTSSDSENIVYDPFSKTINFASAKRY